jgi:hypothetical protein
MLVFYNIILQYTGTMCLKNFGFLSRRKTQALYPFETVVFMKRNTSRDNPEENSANLRRWKNI